MPFGEFCHKKRPRTKNKKKKTFPVYPDFSINLNTTISLSTHHCIRISVVLKTKNPAVPTETFSGEELPLSVILLSTAVVSLPFNPSLTVSSTLFAVKLLTC